MQPGRGELLTTRRRDEFALKRRPDDQRTMAILRKKLGQIADHLRAAVHYHTIMYPQVAHHLEAMMCAVIEAYPRSLTPLEYANPSDERTIPVSGIVRVS